MTLTPQQQKENLDQIVPFALLIGYLGNGKLDGCIVLNQEDFHKETKKFETYKVFKVTDDKKESL